MTAFIQSIDNSLFQAVNGAAGHSHVLDVLMIAIAQYSPELFAALLVALWLSWQRQRQVAALLAGTSALLALSVGQLVALALPRERPFQVSSVHLLIHHSTDGSFPSDHATLVFAVAAMLLAFDRRVGVPALIVAFWTAMARVYVGAHYPTDVLGGAILGTGVSWVVYFAAQQPRPARALDLLFQVLGRARLAVRSGPPLSSEGD